MATIVSSKSSTIPLLTLLVSLRFVGPTDALAVDLRGTAWEQVAWGHRLDPHLMYAVALVESRRGAEWFAPWPWALRTQAGPVYAQSKLEALEALYRGSYRGGCVDVGLMQISTCWHAGRVGQLYDLLDPMTNLRVGAQILREALESAPDDLELAVGRYHTWSSEIRARSYGRRVLALRARLLSLTAENP